MTGAPILTAAPLRRRVMASECANFDRRLQGHVDVTREFQLAAALAGQDGVEIAADER